MIDERQFEEIQTFIEDNNRWSVKTFGECNAAAPASHLLKEVKELYDALVFNESRTNVCFEFADCFILLMQTAFKYGLTFPELFDYAKDKMLININRKWTPREDGTYQHID